MNKERIHQIIFESDTRAGKAFDVVLLFLILVSTVLVMLDSIPSYREMHGELLSTLEWIITICFTIEYLLRIYSLRNKAAYVTSFFGIVDILSILPTYLSLAFGGAHYLSIIRTLRLLRIFRIFNLNEYMAGGLAIYSALRESRRKILVFLVFITLVVFVFGGVMYLVESKQPESGFENIPISIYWAIVTITTVGYGDISPVTPLGRFLASLIMIIGYAVIAVPTGIVTSEMTRQKPTRHNPSTCSECCNTEHTDQATYCCKCGARLLKK